MAGFKQGKSGNPSGRPKGIWDKRTELRALLEPHAKELIAEAVALATQGDVGALRLCIERLVPALRTEDRPVKLPTLSAAKTLSEQGTEVIAALSAGTITPDEATSLMQAIAANARIVETDELVRRVTALESKRHK